MSFGMKNVILSPGAGRFVPVPGQPHTHKAGADETGGAYVLWETALTGQGPPQHIHHAEEEAVSSLFLATSAVSRISCARQALQAFRWTPAVCPR